MLSRWNALKLIFSACIIVILPLTAHYLYNGFQRIAMYQGDMAGPAYVWMEKRVLGKVIHTYSPTYNSYTQFELNNPFISLIPFIIYRITDSLLAGILFMEALSLAIGFISMYLLALSFSTNKASAYLAATLYIASPLLSSIYFIPSLKFAYAITPLIYYYTFKILTENMNIEILTKLLLVVILLVWTAPNHYGLILAGLLIMMIILIFSKHKEIHSRKPIHYAVILIILTGPFMLILQMYSLTAVPQIYQEILWERLASTKIEWKLLSLREPLQYLGFACVDSILRAKYNYITYLGFYKLWSQVYAIIIWIPIGLYIYIYGIRSKTYAYILITHILLYGVNYYYGTLMQISSSLGLNLLTKAFHIYRDPGRIVSITAPLVFAIWSKYIHRLSLPLILRLKDGFIPNRIPRRFINSHLILLIVLTLVIVQLLYLPGSMISLKYVHPADNRNAEWPEETYKKMLQNTWQSMKGYYTSRVLDLTVTEPRFLYIGEMAFPYAYAWRIDLAYYYRSPSFREMLLDWGFDTVLVSNYTPYWYFIRDPYMEEYLDYTLTKLSDRDGITLYSVADGKRVLWIYVPKLTPGLCINVEVTGEATASQRQRYAEYVPEGSGFIIDAWVKLYRLGLNRSQDIISIGKNIRLSYGWGYDLYYIIGSAKLKGYTPVWWTLHHIRAVYFRGEARLYIDGRLVDEEPVSYNGSISPEEITIGGVGDRKLQGEIVGIKIRRLDNITNLDSTHMLSLSIVSQGLYRVCNRGPVTYYGGFVKVIEPLEENADNTSGIYYKGIIYGAGAYTEETIAYLDYKTPSLTAARDLWVEPRIPVQGPIGANDISLLAAYNFKAKPVIVDTETYPRNLPVVIGSTTEPLDLWIKFSELNQLIVKLYEYYLNSEGFTLSSFGRYYWRKPFMGAINSNIYGIYTYAPYQLSLFSRYGKVSFTIKIDSRDYVALLHLAQSGNAKATYILTICGEKMTKELRSPKLPIAGWLELGSFSCSYEGETTARLEVLKHSGSNVVIDALLIMPKKLYEKSLENLPPQVVNHPYITLQTFGPLPLASNTSKTATSFSYGEVSNLISPSIVLEDGGVVEFPLIALHGGKAELHILLSQYYRGSNLKVEVMNSEGVMVTKHLNITTCIEKWFNIHINIPKPGVYTLRLTIDGDPTHLFATLLIDSQFRRLAKRSLELLQISEVKADKSGGEYWIQLEVKEAPLIPLILYIKEPYMTLKASCKNCPENFEPSIYPSNGILASVGFFEEPGNYSLEIFHSNFKAKMLHLGLIVSAVAIILYNLARILIKSKNLNLLKLK